MSTFLHGSELHEEVKKLLKKKGVECAVAFWGKGAEKLIDIHDKKLRIICNLRAGGTNPDVIKKIPRVCVKQSNTLHAKVYISDDCAIVTSANMSANGLGLEGVNQNCWIETGIQTTDVSPIKKWFRKQWNASDAITDDDLKRAKKEWLRRQESKPTLNSFRDYDIDTLDLPIITWEKEIDSKSNEKSIEEAIGYCSDELKRRVDIGSEVSGDEDRRAYKRGAWELRWRPKKKDGKPSRRNLSWANFEHIIPGAWANGTTVAVPAKNPPPDPFDPNEPNFRKAFQEVMEQEKYLELWAKEYEDDWVSPSRRILMNKAWRDIRKRCDELT